MKERSWGTRDTKGLSRRMACRLRVFLDDDEQQPSYRMSAANMALDRQDRATQLPGWLANLDVTHYNDSWNDWQPSEVRVIRERLEAGHERELIEAAFRPPQRVFRPRKEIAEVLAVGKPEVPQPRPRPDEQPGQFSLNEIPDWDTRDYANQQWEKYADRVDLEQPTNRSAVRSLIVGDLLLRNLDRKMLDPDIKATELAALQKQYTEVRRMYSAAAEDVAQLERQRENRQITQTFSQLIERTHEIRGEWQRDKTALHHQLEESALIQSMVSQHRVDVRPVERAVQRDGDLAAGRMETLEVDELTSRSAEPKDVVRSVLND